MNGLPPLRCGINSSGSKMRDVAVLSFDGERASMLESRQPCGAPGDRPVEAGPVIHRDTGSSDADGDSSFTASR